MADAESGSQVAPFLRKLRHGAPLSGSDELALTRLVGAVRPAPRGDIVLEGVAPRSIFLIVHGWVCRYKQLENGKRQVTSLYLPGDLCQPFGALPRVMDHTLAALTPVLLARMPPGALRDTVRANPCIEQALWWDLLVTEGIAREHMVSLGRRSATERLGHLFCEIHLRLGMVGLADGAAFDLPLTQTDLADFCGLSAVHVNRSLQELRGEGLLSLRDHRLTINDLRALRELSMFDPTYLTQTNLPALTDVSSYR